VKCFDALAAGALSEGLPGANLKQWESEGNNSFVCQNFVLFLLCEHCGI
jgi:hypothetical protein